ncbi:H-NS family nucleoid-associated regulatory protein [Burkholderia diffusa]|uniref:H-NS histone family protein n=1 Tax=Burkholderia diffusa TaxID=488732 RepID=UPI001E3605C8|nr:H-NS histone family protein [Burkholderia diffusa]
MEELLAQRARLDKEIETAQADEYQDALRQIRYLMALYQISNEELEGAGSSRKRSLRKKIAPKYWDPQTGQTWSGRGRTPLWLAGKDWSAFRIDPAIPGSEGADAIHPPVKI